MKSKSFIFNESTLMDLLNIVYIKGKNDLSEREFKKWVEEYLEIKDKKSRRRRRKIIYW